MGLPLVSRALVSLAYLSMAAWMEIMLNSMANNPIDTGFGFTLEGNNAQDERVKERNGT